MTLQASGPISLNDIQTEFGGANPIDVDEYYGKDWTVPSSGVISVSDFYSAANRPNLPNPTTTITSYDSSSTIYAPSGLNHEAFMLWTRYGDNGYSLYTQISDTGIYGDYADYRLIRNTMTVPYDTTTLNSTPTQHWFFGSASTVYVGGTWKPDGSKLMLVRTLSNNSSSALEIINVPTAWSLASLTQSQSYTFPTNQVSGWAKGMDWSHDGMNIYILDYVASGSTGVPRIVQYTVTSPWTVTGIAYKATYGLTGSYADLYTGADIKIISPTELAILTTRIESFAMTGGDISTITGMTILSGTTIGADTKAIDISPDLSKLVSDREYGDASVRGYNLT